MSHESGLYALPEHLMQVSIGGHKGYASQDIGEARIIHTLFGRAKVRVVRERDKKRRLRILAVLVIVLATIVGWEGWDAMQRAEQLRADEALASSSGKIVVSEPAYQPELKNPSSRAQSIFRKTKSLIQSEIDSLVIRHKEPPPVVTIAPRQVAAPPVTANTTANVKPDAPKVATAVNKPQSVTASTTSKPASNPVVDHSQTQRLTIQGRPEIPVVPTPAATQPAEKTVLAPAEAKPAVPQTPIQKQTPVAPAAAPVVKDTAAAAKPASDSPASAVVKTQP